MTDNQNIQGQETPRENEIADYYDGVRELEMKGYQDGIKKARTALFVTAGLLLIGEVISASSTGLGFPPFLIGFIAVEVGIFIGLALWTRSKPYTAIIVGLIAFGLLWVLSIYANGGAAIYKGIIVRAIIIYTLVKALGPAKAWEQAKKG